MVPELFNSRQSLTCRFWYVGNQLFTTYIHNLKAAGSNWFGKD